MRRAKLHFNKRQGGGGRHRSRALFLAMQRNLEDRRTLISTVARAGADAVIASYGTIRDEREAFGEAAPILKLDLTTVTLGSSYEITDHVPTWTLEHAMRLGVRAVMTYIQLGAPFELDALKAAGRIAADCDRHGIDYICEIMPVESPRFPDAYAPDAIAASCRTGAELGAHVIKTTMPSPAAAIAESVSCGTPIILAAAILQATGAATWPTFPPRWKRAPAASRSGAMSGARPIPARSSNNCATSCTEWRERNECDEPGTAGSPAILMAGSPS